MKKKIFFLVVFMFIAVLQVNAESYVFNCDFEDIKATKEYKLEFEVINETVNMISCKYGNSYQSKKEDYKDCSKYKISNQDYYTKNSVDYCPVSINVDSEIITLLSSSNGRYVEKFGNQSEKTAKSNDSCLTCYMESNDCASCDGCMLDSENRCVSMYHNGTSEFTSCGGGMLTEIPVSVPKIISITYTAIEIAVPIVLVVLGMIDLFKALVAGKDDEIKKNQSILVKRLIAAVLVFFVLVIVKFLITLFADNGSNIMSCVECFVKNACGV